VLVESVENFPILTVTGQKKMMHEFQHAFARASEAKFEEHLS
jgi:hypothetical protein